MLSRLMQTNNSLKNVFRAGIYVLIFCTLIFSKKVVAQSDYFQQHVAYDLSVTLNDKQNTLNGNINIQYRNNSPDTLNFIWMHLWPNAYANNETALGKQLIEDGSSSFYFAKADARGYIDQLEFKADNKNVVVVKHSLYNDIVKLQLNELLLPGNSVNISTPFNVQIPLGVFSRLGHIGESYQISQWYPKPAVYDKYGWHPMPYLNEGEFYSEFGSFKVAITLPRNYVVAATGELQEETEKLWLLDKVEATKAISTFERSNAFPQSDTALKTITFIQDSIHDFAWFADKRFHVLKSDFQLESGKPVEAWSFFTNANAPLWVKGNEYIASGIRFYSSKIGDYPYKSFTAVDGTISAGGGMEYPMITVIGQAADAFTLEDVIVHELGHSWFFGILASNERDHGWMDEGMNTAYELWYSEYKYPGESGIGKNDLGGESAGGRFLGTDKLNMRDAMKVAYSFSAFNNSDQPVSTPSSKFAYINYGTVMYGKTALSFGFLEEYLGNDVYESAIKTYFTKWKFKHPYPEDVEEVFETSTGKNLDWFFKDLFQTNYPASYKIKCAKAAGDSLHLTIKNNGCINAPFKISELGGGSIWSEGFKEKQTISLPNYKGGDLEINSGYSQLFKSGNTMFRDRLLFPSSPRLKVSLLTKLSVDATTKRLLVLPAFAWNRYNGGMAGIVFSNFSYIPTKFEFSIVPLFDFRNKIVAGTGMLSYHWWPLNGKINEVTFKLNGKRFAYADNTANDPEVRDENPVLNYIRLAPELYFGIRKKNARASIQQGIGYRNTGIWLDEVEYRYNSVDSVYEPRNLNTYFNYHEIYYKLINSRTIDPFGAVVKLENGKNYTKLSGEFKYHITYKKFKKGADIRFFAGGFLDNGNANKQNTNFRMSGWSGDKDYLYEEMYFGRTDYRGLWKQQFVIRDGGFKTPAVIGQSNKWLTALNIDVDIPVPLPISLFGSFAIYHIDADFEIEDRKLLYEAGIAIKPIRNIFEIYIPIFYSNEIDDNLELNNINFVEQIRFVLNIHRISPYFIRNNLIDQYQ